MVWLARQPTLMSTSRIDAHMHWWTPQRGDYGWLTASLPTLYRDFGPQDAEPLLRSAGIDGVVLVQAAPTLAETRYLLELAETRGYVEGVVGWVDFSRPRDLEELAGEPLLVGLRPMLQDLEPVEWILGVERHSTLKMLSSLDIPFEALVRPAHLPVLCRLLDRHPRLRLMIDHAAKPNVAGPLADWRRDLALLAQHARVFCKLSGLVTEAPASTPRAALTPIVDTLLETFGPERLIWGSDWPVVTLRMEYTTWHEWSLALLDPLAPADRAAIFGGNARRFYRLRGACGGVAPAGA